MPPAAADFTQAVRSGRLGPQHAFFQLVSAGSALFSGSQQASAPGFWEQYPALHFLASEARVAGPRCYDLLRGYGWAGSRRADEVPDPERLLIPLPSARQLSRSDMPINVTPGPDKQAILIALKIYQSAGWATFRRGSRVVCPAVIITDGKALTAGVRVHKGEVIGLTEKLSREEVARILALEPDAQAEALEALVRDKLTSTVQEFLLMASPAGRSPIRIGFHASDENDAELRTTQLQEMRQAALSCLRCLELGRECSYSPALPSDSTPLAHIARPCVSCAEEGGDDECMGFWPFNTVMDCAAVNQSMLLRMEAVSGGLSGPASGILHYLKKLRNFSFRWWLWREGYGYVCLHMCTWLWNAEDPQIRAAWRAACPVNFAFNPQMMLSDTLVQMWCREKVVSVLKDIQRDHGGAAVRVLPYPHSRFPLPQHDSAGRFEGIVLSKGREKLIVADAELNLLVQITLHGIVTLDTILGVSGEYGKVTGTKPFVLGTRELLLSRPGAICLMGDVVVAVNRHGGAPSNLVCIDSWWAARLGSSQPPPSVVSIVPLGYVPFSIAPADDNLLLMTLVCHPSTVQLYELGTSAPPVHARVASSRKVFTSALLLREVGVGPERVRGVCATAAWGGKHAVILDAPAMGGRLWLWNYASPEAQLVLLDQGAELGQPHTIVESQVAGEFVISSMSANQMIRWIKPIAEDDEQLLATVMAGDGTCRNASGPLRTCAIAQPSAFLRVGESYWVCALGGTSGGALFLLDTLKGFIAYAEMARSTSQGFGIVDADLRGEEAAALAARVRLASVQTVMDTQARLEDFFKPWLAERLETFGGSNASALNGSHAAPVGATVLTMSASGAWYREVVRMIREEFGDAVAEIFLRMPASGLCNERCIEASFGRIVHGGLTIPAPDLLQYLERRSHDILSGLRLACIHPAMVLKGSNSRSTYDSQHEDADESPLCGRKPLFASIAAFIPRRSNEPQAPPIEVVREAEEFCRAVGPKVAARPVTSIYRPPPGAKPNVPQPVNRAAENARISDGVFDRPPTGRGIPRTFKVNARAGRLNLQPGSVVLMMPRTVIIDEPYWLGEVAAFVELPDEDEYDSTYVPIRYLERFCPDDLLRFCVGKPARVPVSRILMGVDGELEVHLLAFRAPTAAERKMKLPAAAAKPLERVYDVRQANDAAFIEVAAQARASLAALAAAEMEERAAAMSVDAAAREAEEAERDAAAQEQQAARRQAEYGAPTEPRRAAPLPLELICKHCPGRSDHAQRNCPVRRAERMAALAATKAAQAAAAAAEEEGAQVEYERQRQANVARNAAAAACLGIVVPAVGTVGPRLARSLPPPKAARKRRA